MDNVKPEELIPADPEFKPVEVVELAHTPFQFKLISDEEGIKDFVFVKDAGKIFSVLLTAMDVINKTFTVPFNSVGDFARMLGETADTIDGARNAEVAAGSGAEGENVGEPKAD